MSDGTPQGTEPIDALCAAPCSEGGFAIGRAGGVLYWSSDYGRLWRTNGTRAGTFELTGQGSALFLPALYPDEGDVLAHTFVGPVLYFEGCTLAEGCELWRTDGTEAGTHLVKDLVLGAAGAKLQELTAVGARLFFTLGGTELWTSDGTAAGTHRVRRLMRARGLAGASGRLFFLGRGTGGEELWVSDGTAAGTRPITAFALDEPFSSFGGLLAAGGRLYASSAAPRSASSARSPPSPSSAPGSSSWRRTMPATPRSTASTARRRSCCTSPTARARAFRPPTSWPVPTARSTTSPTPAPASSPSGAATAPGAARWWCEWPVRGGGQGQFLPQTGLAAFAGRLWFAVDDGVHGSELWTSDGTSEGTALVADIRPGPLGSSPGHSILPGGLVAAGSALYFAADDGVHGIELWTTDGTAAGTRLVEDLAPGRASSFPLLPTLLGTRLLFSADDGETGRELWELDTAD